MLSPRMLQRRPYPNFKLDELPEAERDEAGSIRANIGDMHSRATSFWAARVLFQKCGEQRLFDPSNEPTYCQWQLCAARDGVMSIYHFGRILEGIDESLAACVSLRDIVDTKAKRAAKRKFEKRFPSYIALRHALAHSAERTKTAKAFKRHGRRSSREIKINPEFSILIPDDDSSFVLHDNIYGTTFSSTWDGELVKCEISDQSGVWLDEITEAYWSAFDGIIDPNPEPPPTVTSSSQPPPGLE